MSTLGFEANYFKSFFELASNLKAPNSICAPWEYQLPLSSALPLLKTDSSLIR
jgi:hypothetical protein